MNDFPLHHASELIRGVIELLWTKRDGLPGNEIIKQLPGIVHLTEDETIISPTANLPSYAQAVRIATLPLVKAGWLIKTDKGQWLITADGRDACRRYLKPEDLYLEAMRLSESDQLTIPEIIATLELIQEKAWESISNYLRGKNAIEIQRLVAALFESIGYHITWMAPPQKKRGLIDMIASTDPVGAKDLRIIIQIKHTGQPVTVEGLKSFAAILGPNEFGLLFSTGGFTSEAREVLSKSDYQKINAMDLAKFYDIWLKHYDKLSREAHMLLPLRAIFFLFPSR